MGNIPTKLATPTSPNSDNTNIRRLNELSLPPWKDRIDDQTLRPERPEYAYLQRNPPNERWTDALRRLEAAISCKRLSLDEFLDQWNGMWILPPQQSLVLQAIAAILYEQEFDGDDATEAPAVTPTPRIGSQVNRLKINGIILFLFEHMLLVDYGFGVRPISGSMSIFRRTFLRFVVPGTLDFGRQLVEFASHCRRGQIPDKEDWKYLARVFMFGFDGFDTADFAIMLYYFQTHHRKLDEAEYGKGMTGYTGVMQELIAEVPSKGPDRLIRKLSVDVNRLIPLCVHDPQTRKAMITVAETIAAKHRIAIYSLDPNSPPEKNPPGSSAREDTEKGRDDLHLPYPPTKVMRTSSTTSK